MEDFSISNGGHKLDGNIFYPEKLKDKNPAILFIQGWTGQRHRSFQYAKSLIKLGYICLLIDLRGHGTSGGNINETSAEQFLSDAIAAYDYLSNLNGVDADNISAVGSSFGGYLVAILSSKRELKNLVLRVPANYPKESFTRLQKDFGIETPGVWEWRNQKREYNETYSLQAIHNFLGQILIIESEKDDVIPHPIIESYINAVKDKSKLTHEVLKNAPHSIKEGKFRDMVEKIYFDWFAKHF